MKKAQWIDDGLSATVGSDVQLARELRFANGTGDDLYDSVRDALILTEHTEEHIEDGDIFGLDPLEYLLRAEDEDEA